MSTKYVFQVARSLHSERCNAHCRIPYAVSALYPTDFKTIYEETALIDIKIDDRIL